MFWKFVCDERTAEIKSKTFGNCPPTTMFDNIALHHLCRSPFLLQPATQKLLFIPYLFHINTNHSKHLIYQLTVIRQWQIPHISPSHQITNHIIIELNFICFLPPLPLRCMNYTTANREKKNPYGNGSSSSMSYFTNIFSPLFS